MATHNPDVDDWFEHYAERPALAAVIETWITARDAPSIDRRGAENVPEDRA